MEEAFTLFNIGAVVLAYLIGSIPTAVWLGKRMYGVDVREHGSRNGGATNTFRVLGKKAGIPVLLFDIFKGWLATMGLSWLSYYTQGSELYINLQIATGVAAIIGHIFPVFASFNGGKGVATTLGVIITLHWMAALSSMGIFVLVFLLTRYVSLGTLISAVAFPILVILIYKTSFPSLMYFSIIFSLVVIITHQKNIQRLVSNEENKISFGNKN
jgi:glycerol-3-phosphate acyltransferase PlsY